MFLTCQHAPPHESDRALGRERESEWYSVQGITPFRRDSMNYRNIVRSAVQITDNLGRLADGRIFAVRTVLRCTERLRRSTHPIAAGAR